MKPNGYRQFNTAYIGIVKKQGKSELAAAVALLLTCDDFEQVEKCMDMLRTDQASIVFDELFAQPNQRLYDVILHGLGDVSKQPLYCLITIAENDQHSICYKVHQIAKDVLEERKIDPTFYPVIYGAEVDDDWMDSEVWKKVNPSLRITVYIKKVEQACESAKQNPTEENLFR